LSGRNEWKEEKTYSDDFIFHGEFVFNDVNPQLVSKFQQKIQIMKCPAARKAQSLPAGRQGMIIGPAKAG
jgi:hypothetical protein